MHETGSGLEISEFVEGWEGDRRGVPIQVIFFSGTNQRHAPNTILYAWASGLASFFDLSSTWLCLCRRRFGNPPAQVSMGTTGSGELKKGKSSPNANRRVGVEARKRLGNLNFPKSADSIAGGEV